MLAGLVLQRLAGGEARLQGCRFGLESSRLTGEGVGALAGLGGRPVPHLQAAAIAERHTARRALFGVLERKSGGDRPQNIQNITRVPAAELLVPLFPQVLVSAPSLRLGPP